MSQPIRILQNNRPLRDDAALQTKPTMIAIDQNDTLAAGGFGPMAGSPIQDRRQDSFRLPPLFLEQQSHSRDI